MITIQDNIPLAVTESFLIVQLCCFLYILVNNCKVPKITSLVSVAGIEQFSFHRWGADFPGGGGCIDELP